MIRRLLVFLVLFACSLGCCLPAFAERHKKAKKEKEAPSIYDVDTLIQLVPRNRQIFQDRIDREQRKADVSDGAVDGVIYFSEDTMLTGIVTQAILTDIDHMQIMIENMPPYGRDAVMDNQMKIRYLTALWELLKKYNTDVKQDPYRYRKLVNNMHDMLIAANENKLMDFSRANMNVYTLDNGKMLFDNHPDVRAYVYTEMGRRDPVMMIKRLSEYANDTFASSIIRDAAYIDPGEVFNFGSSTKPEFRNAVRRCQDPLVQTIVRIADKSKSPLKAMPFLNDIYSGRKSIAEVDEITANPDLFFQNLVRIKLENNRLGGDTYSDELAYRSLTYTREMDDLHESPDPVRFKCLDNLGPEALYYIMVYGQDEIYTSSFLGAFKRMMERMKPSHGDEILDHVHYEHFRTFIRMCAGYNTLNDFLATMDNEKKAKLMSDFIAGLQQGKDDDLEDAVDVADAYGSVKDSLLAEFLQNKVKENYELSYRQKSKKGVIIYGLLTQLFEGNKINNNDTDANRESSTLGLPPIYLVPYKKLLGDTTVVFEQAFFYGDEDGKNSYENFMGMFKDGKWKVVNEKFWSTISSTSGKPVVIYANVPVPEPGDEEAQAALCKYLADQNIKPTVIIHRGHSYHLTSTMEHLTKSTRVVMLGSCGGYHNLAVVLDHSPDAHIISSKQTGMERINEPIIKSLNQDITEGNDIDWIKMWNGLDEYFSKKGELKDKFSDYVPPYKNLGAIFIKAYRRMLNQDDES